MANVTIPAAAVHRLPRHLCARTGVPADCRVRVSAAKPLPAWCVPLVFFGIGILIILAVVSSSGAVTFDVPMSKAALRRRALALTGVGIAGPAFVIVLIWLAVFPGAAPAVASVACAAALGVASWQYRGSSLAAKQRRSGEVVLLRAHPAYVAAVEAALTAPAPGWYADPGGSPALRWWDGLTWTVHVHPAAG